MTVRSDATVNSTHEEDTCEESFLTCISLQFHGPSLVTVGEVVCQEDDLLVAGTKVLLVPPTGNPDGSVIAVIC